MLHFMKRLFLILALPLFLFGNLELAQSQTPLSSAKVDSIQLEDTDLKSALEFLSAKAAELNASPSNFVIYDPLGQLAAANPKITLSLRDTPLSTVVKYACELSKTSYLIDSHVVLIGQKTDLAGLQNLRRARPTPPANHPILKSLQTIRVPSLSFDDTPLSETLEFLRQVSSGSSTASAPLNLVIRPGAGAGNDPGTRKITLNLNNVSLMTALQYVTELGGCAMRFDQRAIVVASPGNIQSPKPVMQAKNPHFDVVLRSRIENTEIEDASISEVLEVISYYCKDPKIAPDGPNFILLTRSEQSVSLALSNIRGIDLLRYFNEQTGTNFRVEADAIVIFDRPTPKKKK